MNEIHLEPLLILACTLLTFPTLTTRHSSEGSHATRLTHSLKFASHYGLIPYRKLGKFDVIHSA